MQQQKTVNAGKLDVDAIFYHEGCNYSVMYKSGSEIKQKSLGFGAETCYTLTHTVLADATDKPWVEWHVVRNSLYGVESGGYVRIHIRSVDDITGGSWNHGKFGTGTTTRIQ